jgi:hypothetical protein
MPNPPLDGSSNSATTAGVLGTNTATNVTSSAQAVGVSGTSTNGVGVSASTQNAAENAIFGINFATGPITAPVNAIAGCGVWGHTNVAGGTGVVGSTDPNIPTREATQGEGATGVLGIGIGAAAGVAGVNNTTLATGAPGGPGVSASSTIGTGLIASSEGEGAGVSATSQLGVGVSASTQNTYQNAIFGINFAAQQVPVDGGAISGCGVWGHTAAQTGGGIHNYVAGVVGSTDPDPSKNATGVIGIGNGTGDGVLGVAAAGVGQIAGLPPPPSLPAHWAGIHGVGGSGPPAPGEAASFAGLFDGAVQINGNLSVLGTVTKGGGGFQIDHPLDPANKYLVHSFVESPDMKNVYDGVAVADSLGEATVELPAYFDALNKDFRYQLTPIGAPAPNLHVQQELTRNRFAIAGAAPGQRVCWQVIGTRKDAWALANPVVVERDKPKSQREHFEFHTWSTVGLETPMELNER